MAENKAKEKFMARPIEQHRTAAWANIEKTDPESNVAIPNETEVINAKEWVDGNQK
ncbi:MAG TPA: DUF3787 domain-containing protein [Desulfobacteria bacterium]|nr:DUF3787 domain-containing protein [Desulfobacteria bacterium]